VEGLSIILVRMPMERIKGWRSAGILIEFKTASPTVFDPKVFPWDEGRMPRQGLREDIPEERWYLGKLNPPLVQRSRRQQVKSEDAAGSWPGP